MANILQYQPFRTLYLVYFLSSLLLVKLPFWFFLYLLPSQRPRPVWTVKRSLILRALQEILGMRLRGRTNNRGRFEEVSDSSLTDAKFVRLEGIPESDSAIFCGEIRRVAEITGVKPTKVNGYWFLKKKATWNGPQAKAGERVVLHVHGGAFAYGTAHPSDWTANISRGLLEHSKTIERTFSVDYRLTASVPEPANPFPAAIVDALAAYSYLVQDCGFKPKNILLVGDSAGGNLALALARHLVENTIAPLPPPGRLFVVSPWIDLLASRNGPNSSHALNAVSDIFAINRDKDEILGGPPIHSLRGPLDLDVVRTNRYFSPAGLQAEPAEGSSSLFKGFMETYVVAGGAERLLDDSKALIERLEADGVKVHADISPDAVHDFLIFKWHEPERTETFRRVCQWIDAM